MYLFAIVTFVLNKTKFLNGTSISLIKNKILLENCNILVIYYNYTLKVKFEIN